LSSHARLFAAGIATETNSFSPIPTGYDDFRKAAADDPQGIRDRIFFGRSFRAYDSVARARGSSLVLGSYSFATPAGPPSRAVFERLRDELLSQLDDAMPVDGVLLTLHGAMVCDGIDDCESDLVARVRTVVGQSTPIGVLLDLHCDLPDTLLAAADVIVVVKEYPHVDVEQCARRLAEIVHDTLCGSVTPTMASFDCRMVGLYPTVREPMRGFVDGIVHAAETEQGILAVSVGHGFPFLDSAHPGARALVVADSDGALAAKVAERVGRALNAIRREAPITPLSLHPTVADAVARGTAGAPIVIADVADNAGGGAPSDSTFLLRALLELGVKGAGLGPLWDPVAVVLAFAAGEQSRLRLRLGGKMGPDSGPPLDVTATVKALEPDLVQRWPQLDGYAEMPMGAAACLEVDGVDVIVTSIRDQAFGLELFTAFGIDPRQKRLLVLKSANHFRAAYDAIAEDVLYVDAGGALPSDPRAVPYTRFDRRAFPWVDDPFELDGV
jgi:microcystin degradation protein MlrC